MGNIEPKLNQPYLEKQHRHLIKAQSLAQPPNRTNFFYFQPLNGLDIQFPETEQQDETVRTPAVIEEIRIQWKSFLKMKEGNFLQQYDIKRELGRGGFGCVYKVVGKYTGIIRAAKKIKKSDMDAKETERLFNEMNLLQSLDHPNIAKLYEVYDHQNHYVLIMEICQGGELFKKVAKNQIKPNQAAKIIKEVLEALVYIHSKGILHRDIKPENIMLEKDTNTVKLIDFGIAVKKKKPNQFFNARIGTAYYIAPQVLCKRYNQKCDVWAVGIVLYMILLHKPPFAGQSEREIMEKILNEDAVFQGNDWAKLTNQCKQLIRSLLIKKPKERPTAYQALQNIWIQQSKKSNQQQCDKTLDRIQQFGFRNQLQAVVYTYTVSQLLTSVQKQGLEEVFKKTDKNSDGVISKEEFKQVMKDRITEQQRLNVMMRLIDLDGSGNIQYTEFLIAALNPKCYLKRQHYQKAFEYFDIDHSGDISYEEVAKFLEAKQSQDSIKKIFCEIDVNGDGTISKQEFIQIFMKERIKETFEQLKIKAIKRESERTDSGKLNKNKKQRTVTPHVQ